MKTITLPQHVEKWKNCVDCPIGTRADRHVFFRGNVPCDILFIGEAPGESEDVVGKPFVGRSGKVLENWITAAQIEFAPLKIGITNMVSCRPCDWIDGPNRAPTENEIENCTPRLQEFFKLAKPVGVVFVGKVAEKYGLKRFKKSVEEGMLLSVFHPAYILRNGGEKSPMNKKVVKKLKRFFEEVYESIPR